MSVIEIKCNSVLKVFFNNKDYRGVKAQGFFISWYCKRCATLYVCTSDCTSFVNYYESAEVLSANKILEI